MVAQQQRAEVPVVARPSSEDGSAFSPLPFTAEDVRREIRRKQRHGRGRVILIVLLVALIALAVASVLVFDVPHSLKTVETSDMEPALSSGQVVYVQDDSDVQAGDVVLIQLSSGGRTLTRIMACPGEWIGATEDNQLVVSDQEIVKGALVERSDSSSTVVLSMQLPESTYFVAGDAIAITEDLLTSSGSYVISEQIVGEATFKVWPPLSIGAV